MINIKRHNLFIFALLISHYSLAYSDTTKQKKELVYNANLSAGYHYGFIQGYTFDYGFPDQLFLTQGNAGLKLFKLPFQVEYRYATMRVPYGLNNYFRVKFDLEKYKQDLEKKGEQINKIRRINTDSLYLQRQDLTKRLLYRQYKLSEIIVLNKDSLKGMMPDSSLLDNYSHVQLLNGHLPDSIQLPDTLKYDWRKNKLTDSILQLVQEYNQYSQKLQNLNISLDSINKINAAFDKMDSLRFDPKGRLNGELGKYKKPVFEPNNFELGTCFPNNSYLMYGTLPVNGIFTDFEYKGVYMSLLYGEVMNNFLFANTFFERQLVSTKNVTNFFDFSNTNRGRKVTALKIGKGKFNENHIHLGFLYGMGLKNYGDTTLISDVNLQPKESNAVIEITSRYTIKRHQFEFALAKSMLDERRSGELFSSFTSGSSLSLAGLVAYSTSFFKERTKFKVLVKHLQPNYRSFGMGFTNGDFLRVNVKVDQKLGRKLTLGAFVKNDIDNLYNLVTFTNNILNYGITSGLRIGRSLNIRLTYNPIIQKITDNESGLNTQFNNYLYNGSISYNKRINKSNIQSVINYNYFEINDITGSKNAFQNFVWSNSVMAKRLTITLTSNYFSTNIIDSLDKNNFMNSLNISFPIKKVTVKVGAKHFSNLADTNDYGALLGLNIPITKLFSINLEGQKFVIGDYFLSNSFSAPNKVPYYFSATLNLRL